MTASTGQALATLRQLLGPQQLLESAADVAAFVVDHRRLYQGRALAVALPRDAQQVAAVLRCCNEAGIGVVPQGGNTSYCGGATPDASGTQLVVALRRMNRVRELDAANSTITVEAGCLLAQVQAAASAAGLLFPLSLGSQGSCQIGGNLATNAGGTSVLRYGMVRDLVLGLEVALPDGRLLSTLTALRKDNTGYDLKSLFVGAEGTLGIITAACLKLFPAPRSTATAFVGLSDPSAALSLLGELRAASDDKLTSFELVPQSALALVLRHIEGASAPLAGEHAWYALVEFTSTLNGDAVTSQLEAALGAAQQQGLIDDATIAQNERQREALWRLRESVPEAQRRQGFSIKHDISVPVSRLPQFLAQASDWARRHVPQGLLVAYGHAGDGNLHFNFSATSAASEAALQTGSAEIQRGIHDLVQQFGGSFSAEHGIGQLKVAELERYASPVELSLMRKIRQAIDPNGIMNPGKVLARPRDA